MNWRWLFVILVLPCLVSAYTTSGTYVSPTTSYDPGAYTTTDSAFSSNNYYAVIAAASADSFAVKTFGISIPIWGTIDSVNVKVEGYGVGSTASRRLYYIALSTDGGVSKNGNWATDTLKLGSDSTVTLADLTNGQVDRLWGATLTPATVMSSDFAVMIKKTAVLSASDQYIDHIQVAVWWTATPDTTKASFYLGAGAGNEADMTYISAAAATTNYGTGVTAILGDSSVGENSILVRWGNIADSLQAGNEFIAACTLFVKASANTNTRGTVHVERVRRADWSESQATWNAYSTGNNWTTAGAKDTTNDADTIPQLEYDANQFTAGSYIPIDLTPIAREMDNEDTALWRGGFIIHGLTGFVDIYVDSAKLDATFTIHTDDATVGYNKPYIKVVTSADNFYSGSPRPSPSFACYAPAVTGLKQLSANPKTKSLGHRISQVGVFDSMILLMDSATTGIHRVVTTANGGTSFTHTTTSFPNSVSGTMWFYGDSGWMTTYLSSATLHKKILKWKQMTAGIYDTISTTRVGDMQAALDVSIFMPLASNSILGIVRPETGTPDSVFLVKSNGAHAQASTWTTVDSGAAIVGTNTQIIPMKDMGGFLMWAAQASGANDTMFWADTTAGFDTLVTTSTGATFLPAAEPYISREMIPLSDSNFVVAYQNNGGALSARAGHVGTGGAKAGTQVDTIIWDATAQTLEADADLPAVISTTGTRYLSGFANPSIAYSVTNNIVYCFYWYWPQQGTSRTDAKYDQAQIVMKYSSDKGATWSATRVVVADTNTAGMPHTKTGATPNSKSSMFCSPVAKAYQQKDQVWLGWSDWPSSTSTLDTIRLAKVNITNDTGAFSLGRGVNEAQDTRLRQNVATTNYGADTLSYFGSSSGGGAMNVYLFTFPTLATNLLGRTVDSAKLIFRFKPNNPVSDDWYGFSVVRPARRDWVETQATWNIWKTGSSWTTAGALSTTDDIFPTVYDTFPNTSITAESDVDDTISVTKLLKAVDGAAADTSSTFVLKYYKGADETQLLICSRNNVVVTRRPYLIVYWHSGVESASTTSPRRRRILGYKEQINAYSIRGN